MSGCALSRSVFIPVRMRAMRFAGFAAPCPEAAYRKVFLKEATAVRTRCGARSLVMPRLLMAIIGVRARLKCRSAYLSARGLGFPAWRAMLAVRAPRQVSAMRAGERLAHVRGGLRGR